MAKGAVAEGSKRKRASASEKPAKRRRSLSEESGDPNAKILLMEQGILESEKNYNDITVLLSTARENENGEPESIDVGSSSPLQSLCSVACPRVSYLQEVSVRKEKDSVVVGWLKDQFLSTRYC
ncbi:Maturation and nuclear export of 40S ribosomal subunits interacting protein [Metarhizium acridum]|nr:Maturation and nuclear export of 40S ribosomal subunits interacting protein [Metarhizium acridum]